MEQSNQPMNELIDVDVINELPKNYPEELVQFCTANEIKLPGITSLQGIALSLMSTYKYNYFNRETEKALQDKFKIGSDDILQAFNKIQQRGFKSNSDMNDRGKAYIVYPYCLSSKHKMRKDFKFNGSEEEKNNEIDKIKSTIKHDYIDVPNSKWQLGHKNPGSTDNSNENLVLQPPIQGKYRDNFIFVDTLTKLPMPKQLVRTLKDKTIEFTPEQIVEYKQIFDELHASL
jgi:hypothetical protein